MTLRAGALLLVLAPCAPAHGPLHEQIERATAEIQKQPGNARLYLKRGELHRHHEEWKKAESDFDRAAELAPALIEVNLARGKLWLDAGQPERAMQPLNRYLRERPGEPDACSVRGAAKEKLGLHRAAAHDYDTALNTQPRDVELVLASARAWAASENKATAIERLDAGIKALGALVTLESAAIDLELSLKQWDKALARVDLMTRQTPRKEGWLARRARILEKAGRKADARNAWSAALAAIESLPDRLRHQPATAKLESQIRAALARSH
jgi:tetratricopeptide (TPR) repeat protein